jgi:uncharacterized cupin superfamily protein
MSIQASTPRRVLQLIDAHTQTVDVDYPKPERLVTGNPRRGTQQLYRAPDGQFSCGVWSCERGAWRIEFSAHKDEYFHVLEGRLQITGADGVAIAFGPGQAGVIPAGFQGVFEVLEPVRKHYVVRDVPAPTITQTDVNTASQNQV